MVNIRTYEDLSEEEKVKYHEWQKEYRKTHPNLSRTPKYVKEIRKYFNQCFLGEGRKKCIHCYDCISFALIFAQKENLTLPSNKPWCTGFGNEFAFIKFLLSTITKQVLHCGKGLADKTCDNYAKWLLRLNPLEKEEYRRGLLCHSEFKDDFKTYKNTLIVLDIKRNNDKRE